MANRNLSGWTRQAYDPRDHQHRVPRKLLAALPDYFDLSPKMGPQRDQKTLGACGPFTADECITAEQIAQGLPPTGASPLFVYYCTRFLMGTVQEDSGVNNRDMLKALAGYGYCSEAEYPYDVSKFKQKPPASVIASAAKNKIASYAAVAKDLATMKGTLVGGDPFIFGFDVYPQMESDECAETGIVAMPKGTSIGGHDVTWVGFNDSGKDRPGVEPGKVWPAGHGKFRNHWMNDDGTPWGDGGYGYFPFPYAVGPHADDFWVISAVPGASPMPPAPPPVPVPVPVPEPAVNYVFNGVTKIPFLGNAQTTGLVTPAGAQLELLAPRGMSFDWVSTLWGVVKDYGWKALVFLWTYGKKYGPIVGPVIYEDWKAGKSWPEIEKDVIAALIANGVSVA